MSSALISVQIIAHSVNSVGDELITLQTRAPKFLDAEIEKHRQISSNSSSDRAIPFNKNIGEDYFIPNDIRANQAGMQGYEPIHPGIKGGLQKSIRLLREYTIGQLSAYPSVHKQHLNRYLLPWAMQDKVMTANRVWFEYFIKLRAAAGADPAVQDLAKKMENAIVTSKPQLILPGGWHMPYASSVVRSVARCARVSYSNHDGDFSTFEQDTKLYNHLKDNQHMTPFEHQATPIDFKNLRSYDEHDWPFGVTHMARGKKLCSGNFHGWIQYRQRIKL